MREGKTVLLLAAWVAVGAGCSGSGSPSSTSGTSGGSAGSSSGSSGSSTSSSGSGSSGSGSSGALDGTFTAPGVEVNFTGFSPYGMLWDSGVAGVGGSTDEAIHGVNATSPAWLTPSGDGAVSFNLSFTTTDPNYQYVPTAGTTYSGTDGSSCGEVTLTFLGTGAPLGGEQWTALAGPAGNICLTQGQQGGVPAGGSWSVAVSSNANVGVHTQSSGIDAAATIHGTLTATLISGDGGSGELSLNF